MHTEKNKDISPTWSKEAKFSGRGAFWRVEKKCSQGNTKGSGRASKLRPLAAAAGRSCETEWRSFSSSSKQRFLGVREEDRRPVGWSASITAAPRFVPR